MIQKSVLCADTTWLVIKRNEMQTSPPVSEHVKANVCARLYVTFFDVILFFFYSSVAPTQSSSSRSWCEESSWTDAEANVSPELLKIGKAG